MKKALHKLIFAIGLCLLVTGMRAQSIDSVEYFFDNDPGVDSGFVYGVTVSDTITDSVAISFTGLQPGFHNLNVRVRDTNGVWSLYETHTFFLNDTMPVVTADFDSSAAEYFFDMDPGVDSAMALLLTPGDTINDTLSIVTDSLTPGFHNIYMRIKDSNNVWSLYEGARFYLYDTITSSALPITYPIGYAEYFYDTDPGIGNGLALNSFTPADTITVGDSLPTLPPLLAGTHYLYVRVKDTMNTWSLYDGRAFIVCNLVPIADFSADTVCSGKPTTLTDLSSNQDTSFNYTYAWDFNMNGTPDDTTKGTATHVFGAAGTYTVTLIVNNTNGCSDTVTKTIYVDSLPTATLTLPMDTVCKDDTLMLSGGSPAGGVYSGPGVFGDTLYCDSAGTGIKTIYYTYYNADSCSVTVTDKIYISKCTGIHEYALAGTSVSIHPNPFNATATVKVESPLNDIRSMRFALFDVFGKELQNHQFESSILKLDREGLPAGIYFYKLIGRNGNYVSGKLIIAD